jgi:hypothetical protein
MHTLHSRGIACAVIAAGSLALPLYAQREVQKLVASTPAGSVDFAARCAIDGDSALVSAPGSNLMDLGTGAAYAYQRVNGTWSETQILLPSAGQSGDSFGWSVAMSGNYAVFGALGSVGTTTTHTGAAYVFERVGTSWVERQKLVPSLAFDGGQFGNVVAISGDRIVVGSWFAATVGFHSGNAYVFERSGAVWNEVAVLQPNDGAANDAFGAAVAIDGDTIAVSAIHAVYTPGVFTGAVYVYKRNALGAWPMQQKLYGGNNVPNGSVFGAAVAVSGTTLFASSSLEPFGNVVRGGVDHVFEEVGGAWNEVQLVTPSDVADDDGFAITHVRDNIAVGSGFADDLGTNSGAAYAFRKTNGTWVECAKFLANDGYTNQRLAYGTAVSGTTVIVGALGDDDGCSPAQDCNTGAAYFFEFAPAATQYGSCNVISPCNNGDGHGGCRNATGQGAVLNASGSGSAIADDLVLEVRDLPPGTATLMFMGGGQSSLLLGSGQLVVGGGALGLYRLGVQFADANGVVVRPAGLVAYSQASVGGAGTITAGQTWNFQCWYRDVLSPCGITNNLSNGLAVEFSP